MIVSDGSRCNREILDRVIAHHGLKIYLIWMDDNYVGFTVKLGGVNLFLGETFKIT